MHVTIRRYKINTDDLSAIAATAQRGFVPILESSPGFVAYYGVDSGHNTITTISVFEDQAGADESNRRAAAWVKENLAQYVEGPPEVSSGEVLWHG
jgi:hypothetical protein